MESSEYIFFGFGSNMENNLAMALENELAWEAKTALVLETAQLSVREQHLIGLG